MRKRLVLGALLTMSIVALGALPPSSIAASGSPTPTAAQPLDLSGYKLTFDESFKSSRHLRIWAWKCVDRSHTMEWRFRGRRVWKSGA